MLWIHLYGKMYPSFTDFFFLSMQEKLFPTFYVKMLSSSVLAVHWCNVSCDKLKSTDYIVQNTHAYKLLKHIFYTVYPPGNLFHINMQSEYTVCLTHTHSHTHFDWLISRCAVGVRPSAVHYSPITGLYSHLTHTFSLLRVYIYTPLIHI